MSPWKRIDDAPKDGSFVIAAKKADWVTAFEHFPYPLKQRWNGSKWEADDGRVYEPQPSHFLPSPLIQKGKETRYERS